LAILNTSKKLKNLHDNILKLKVHFESKFSLDPMVKWKGLNKINVHKISNL
jgi:hypothetical protein